MLIKYPPPPDADGPSKSSVVLLTSPLTFLSERRHASFRRAGNYSSTEKAAEVTHTLSFFLASIAFVLFIDTASSFTLELSVSGWEFNGEGCVLYPLEMCQGFLWLPYRWKRHNIAFTKNIEGKLQFARGIWRDC